MKQNRWSKVLGTMVVIAAVPVAMAAEPIKLNCPAGTRQASRGSDIVGCEKTDGSKRAHGPTVYLYPNGTKQAEGSSEDGFRSGFWTLYDEQGRKTGTITFKRGNFHGEVVELHANGQVKKVERYVEGLRNGTAQEFSAEGKLVKQTEYRDNREVASK